jgi:hypothetical protein
MSIRQFSPLPPNCVVAVVAGGSQISRKRWRNRNLRNIRQRYLQIVAHYDGYDDRFAIPAAIVAATASATAEIPGNPRNYVDYDGYDAKMGRKARFALEGSKAMNKDMLDRLRSAVCEGSQQSAESRPDKAAVQRWINDHFIASPPGVCAHCGGGERAGDPFVIMFVHHDRADVHSSCHAAWRAEREAEAVAALDLKESA